MREKFERWEFSTDEEKLAYEKSMMIPESEEIQASLNTTRNLRAMFENLQYEPPKPEKPRIKVNRFVWWLRIRSCLVKEDSLLKNQICRWKCYSNSTQNFWRTWIDSNTLYLQKLDEKEMILRYPPWRTWKVSGWIALLRVDVRGYVVRLTDAAANSKPFLPYWSSSYWIDEEVVKKHNIGSNWTSLDSWASLSASSRYSSGCCGSTYAVRAPCNSIREARRPQQYEPSPII